MEKNEKKKQPSEMKEVAKGFSMILQIGLNMVVCVAIGLLIGHCLDRWLGTGYWTVIFLFIGFAAGIRSVYSITKGFYAKDLKKEKERLEYFDELYSEHEKNARDDSEGRS